MSSPVFVVVGHVNRGKSSIVSTLAADDSVLIDAMPGTTQHCREYPMRVGGETLYTLIDTPGFERPRQVLGWFVKHETSTAKRRQVVESFIAEHRASGAYRQECDLLEPVLAGASILYVVDGSKPPSPNYEAEMEILRWTAQPRVALVNSTGKDDYTDQWKSVLDQYFNMVRPFNAHEADFDQRMRLLRLLREMSDQTRAPLDAAIRNLIEDRRRAQHDAATAIAEMLAEMLTLVVDKKISMEADADQYRERLAARYYDRQRDLESACRRQLKQSFLHHHLRFEESKLTTVDEDLFNLDSWNRLGLSRTKLATAGAAAGALAGGVVDAAVGGASFLAGMLLGGAAAGAASWLAAGKLPEVKIQGIALGGQRLSIGPMRNPSFPWVALDRALLFLDVVARRPHAKRDAAKIDQDAGAGIVASVGGEARATIERLFARLRPQPGQEAVDELTAGLTDEIEKIIVARHQIEAEN